MATEASEKVEEEHPGIGGPADMHVEKATDITSAKDAPDEAGRGGPADMAVDSTGGKETKGEATKPLEGDGKVTEQAPHDVGIGGPCDMPLGTAEAGKEGGGAGGTAKGKASEDEVSAALSAVVAGDKLPADKAPPVVSSDRALPPASGKDDKPSWFGKEGMTAKDGSEASGPLKEGEYPKGVSHEAFDKFKENFTQGIHGGQPGTRGIGETSEAKDSETKGSEAKGAEAKEADAAKTVAAPVEAVKSAAGDAAGAVTDAVKSAEAKSTDEKRHADAKSHGWFTEDEGTKTRDAAPGFKEGDVPKGVSKEGYEKFKREFEEGIHGGKPGTRGVGEEASAATADTSKAVSETLATAGDEGTKAVEKSAGWFGKEDLTKSKDAAAEFKEGDHPKGVSKEGFEAFKEQFRHGLHSAKEAVTGVREAGSSFLQDASKGAEEMRPSVIAATKDDSADSTEPPKTDSEVAPAKTDTAAKGDTTAPAKPDEPAAPKADAMTELPKTEAAAPPKSDSVAPPQADESVTPITDAAASLKTDPLKV